MIRYTNYCCCTQTVKCRYCIWANLEPFIHPKEPINKLENMNYTKYALSSIDTCTKSIGKYVVGSFSVAGGLSFNNTPVLHDTEASARAECRRLSTLNPGTMYLFVKLSGGEMTPTATISI